jgi:hypothetical protein
MNSDDSKAGLELSANRGRAEEIRTQTQTQMQVNGNGVHFHHTPTVRLGWFATVLAQPHSARGRALALPNLFLFLSLFFVDAEN